VLVAAAYFLSYRLRFDFQHVPRRYELLFERTIAWAVVSSVVIFALFGLYQKWWRYVG
jgi:FlaA1/EpsC-like NDP-sugar epimerase